MSKKYFFAIICTKEELDAMSLPEGAYYLTHEITQPAEEYKTWENIGTIVKWAFWRVFRPKETSGAQ